VIKLEINVDQLRVKAFSKMAKYQFGNIKSIPVIAVSIPSDTFLISGIASI
jgi:hypothetical protein